LRIAELGLDLFSRRPIVSNRVERCGRDGGYAAIELQLTRGRATILVVQSPPRFGNGSEASEERKRLLATALPEFLSGRAAPTILVGDFEASMWSPFYRQLMQRANLQDGRQGYGLLFTHRLPGIPGGWLWCPSDHCLYNAGCLSLGTWTGPDFGSEHLPMAAEFDLIAIADAPNATAPRP